MIRKKVLYDKVSNTFLFECPHCDNQIQVLKSQINCKIFRHGIYKNTFKQINPHLSKNKCEELVTKNLVFGCAKPFKFIDSIEPYVEVCDYI